MFLILVKFGFVDIIWYFVNKIIFLNHNIKWIQKAPPRKLPFVGKASDIAGHIFVDNSSITSRINTMVEAKKILEDGVSLIIFPEGARTKNGKLGAFRRGAYRIALDMGLPIVPVTLNGPYDVMKRNTYTLYPGKLELTIHQPIPTKGLQKEDIAILMDQTKETIHSALWEKYK